MPPWKRTFAALWLANTITAIGMMAFLPFFPSHLIELGLTDRDAIATWAGVLYGAAPLCAAIASPFWGVLGDRVGRRWMVLRSMLAITLFVGGMSYASGPWQLLALRVGQGLFSGFVAPSITLVSLLAPPDKQSRMSGWLNTSMVIGAIVGPLLGEILRHRLGVREVYGVVAVLSAVAAVLVFLFAYEDRSLRRDASHAPGARGVLRATLGDIAEIRGQRALRASIALLFWLQFGLGATNPLLELHVADLTSAIPGLVPSTGALFFSMSAANLIAMPLWGRYGDARGAYPALRRCAAACAAALVLQAAATNYELLLVGRVAFGAAMAGSAPLAFGVAAAESSAQRRGGAVGVVFAARAFAIAIASMVGGALSAWIGVRGLFLGSGLILGAYLVHLALDARREARSA
ncbi:MAG: MFS transporter [Planctomycetes bacterium]|nr:MFS transporter [Planctomycetota bacterium]